MATVVEDYCTILISSDRSSTPTQDEICRELEQPDLPTKLRAIKSAIGMLLSGEPMPRLLMSVIKGCLREESKELKKLVMIYWEVAKKYGPDGKLLPEMILVCNALRNDLSHPNEYIRGATLRFLCRLREPELLEPLIPTIKACLECHGSGRHFYIRKYAALACYYIHSRFGESLLPDGPEIMQRFIENEADASARRNAFLFLYNEAEGLAIDFLNSHMDRVNSYGDGFQLLVLELCRKVCRRDPAQKSRFVRVLLAMLQSDSAAVSYEAAWTMVSLSSAPTAIRAAAATYAQLLIGQSDNNMKLIVLERLAELKKVHAKVLQEVLMDILRALSSPNVDICKKVLEVTMDLVTPRNIDEVVQLLKRELLRTQEADMEKGLAYRTLLIQAIHTCAQKSPEVASSVVHVLMDFLGGEGALEVALFVRTIVDQYPNLRLGVLSKLMASIGDISSPAVLRVSLWVLGTYCDDNSSMAQAFTALIDVVGSPPFDGDGGASKNGGGGSSAAPGATTSGYTTKNVVLSDGTYATQTVVSAPSVQAPQDGGVAPLRKLIAGGDVLLATSLCSSLTKITLRAMKAMGSTTPAVKQMQVATLTVICGVSRVVDGVSSTHSGAFDDCLEQLRLQAAALLDEGAREALEQTYLASCKESFAGILAKEKDLNAKQAAALESGLQGQPDQLISFRQLLSTSLGGPEIDLYDGDDITRATGAGQEEQQKRGHVCQLSGFADPVYAEACVTVHDYDIVLEILLINRTPNTLTNLTVELATMGDLRLVERPQAHTIGPLDQRTISANIKVSSTETGYIFGTIVYENSSTAEKTYINLNDIHLDIMDYIKPGQCTDHAFRSMWAEFEWENKVAISTKITNLHEFLSHIVTKTNMTCLTPSSALDGSSSFLAANLYAVSVFGEGALMNVSVEKKQDAGGALSGHVRIRSKTQGIALSLGDRVSFVMQHKDGENAPPTP
jgi:coatomer subunit beta